MKVVQERNQAVNARDWDRFFGTYAESVVAHAPGLQEPQKGIEALKGRLGAFFTAFEDFRANIVNSFGQGDWVVVEQEFTGTHTGTLVRPDGLEIPPTNKIFKSWSVDVLKVEGGEIAEVHTYLDQLGFLAQLGLGPK